MMTLCFWHDRRVRVAPRLTQAQAQYSEMQVGSRFEQHSIKPRRFGNSIPGRNKDVILHERLRVRLLIENHWHRDWTGPRRGRPRAAAQPGRALSPLPVSYWAFWPPLSASGRTAVLRPRLACNSDNPSFKFPVPFGLGPDCDQQSRSLSDSQGRQGGSSLRLPHVSDVARLALT